MKEIKETRKKRNVTIAEEIGDNREENKVEQM